MKRKTMVITSVIIIFIILVVLLSNYFLGIRNIYDETYYAMTTEPFFFKRVSFFTKTVLPANTTVSKDTPYYTYNGEILRANEQLSVSASQGAMSIVFTVSEPNEVQVTQNSTDKLKIQFQYAVYTKTLTYMPIEIYHGTPENMNAINASADPIAVMSFMKKYGYTKTAIEELQRYVIRDVILTQWIETNQEASRFGLDNIGDVAVVNLTFFEFSDEDKSELERIST